MTAKSRSYYVVRLVNIVTGESMGSASVVASNRGEARDLACDANGIRRGANVTLDVLSQRPL